MFYLSIIAYFCRKYKKNFGFFKIFFNPSYFFGKIALTEISFCAIITLNRNKKRKTRKEKSFFYDFRQKVIAIKPTLKIRPVERDFTVTGFFTAFRFNWDGEFVFHGENHDFWEIVFVSEGSVESVEDENIYLVKENQLILHAPLEFHRIRTAEGERQKGIIMSFKTAGSLPEELKDGVFTLKAEEKAEYTDLCRGIMNFVQGNGTYYTGQEVADHLAAFLIRLSQKTPNRDLASSVGASEYHRIVSSMTDRVCENLTLTDFARIHNISVSYLKLLFKTYAGISPKTYFNQMRARHAAHLLTQNHTIAEIAEKMNFSSQNYFTVFFRNYMGSTPSEYRKQP